MQVYVSTLNFGAGPLSGTVSELSRLTYPAVEISSGHTPEDDTFGPVLSYAQDYKASVILHNFAPPETGSLLVNLSEPDANGRDSVIKFIKSRIDLTKELGSDYYSFHGGYRVPFRFGVRDYLASETLDRQVALEIFLQGLREVVAHAEAQRVHIGVENHVAMRESEGKLILYDQADFEVMFSEVGSDFLHLHLDVGHLKVTCEALEVDPTCFYREIQR